MRMSGFAPPACAGAAAVDLRCQLRRYATLVRTEGVDAAFVDFKRAYEREGFVRAACHPIVHQIGHAAVDRYGEDLPESTRAGTRSARPVTSTE